MSKKRTEELLNNRGKKITVLFVPWFLDGDVFLILCIAIIITPLIIIGFVTQGFIMLANTTIGQWLSPIPLGYFDFFLTPILLLLSPEEIVTSVSNSISVSETQIQSYFNSLEPLGQTTGICSYSNLIFAVIMFILILMLYNKKVLKGGWFRWIIRYLVINTMVSIPITYFLWNKLNIYSNYVVIGDYSEIFNSVRKQIIDLHFSFILVSIIVTFFSFFLISSIQKNRNTASVESKVK